MRKVIHAAACMTAVMFLFAGTFFSCKQSDDSDDDSSSATFTAQSVTITNDTSTLGLTATSAQSGTTSVATATLGSSGIVITSVAAGSATVTCTDASSHTASIAVTVASSGAITYVVTKYGSSSETTVNAVWEFDAQPEGIATAEGAVSSISLSPDSGTGASLSVTATKLKYVSGCLAAGRSSGSDYTAYATKATTTLTITTTATATITINVDGAGSASTDRWAVLCDSTGNQISYVTNLASGTIQAIKDTDAAAGTYTLYLNGSRLQSLTVSNQTFAAATDSTTANTSDVLGLVATNAVSADTSIATVAIVDGYVAITSVAPGSVKITLDDGAKHYASVTVTVAVNGGITIGTITKNAFVVSTTTTANSIANLGLSTVATSVSSSDATVATAVIGSDTTAGSIVVTSVAAGSATLTCSDGTYSATIAVTVASDGTISIGTITKPFIPQSVDVSYTDLNLTVDSYSLSSEGFVTVANNTSNSKVSITSVAQTTSDVTITLKDSSLHTALVVVAVDAYGAITKTVTAYSAFSADTKVITNDSATLGLTATSVSVTSGAGYVSAAIPATGETNAGNIVLTSLAGNGSATVACSNGANSASIAVTVAIDGTISYTITKYVVAGTVTLFNSTDTTYSASAAVSSSGVLTVSDATFAWNPTTTIKTGYPSMYTFTNTSFTTATHTSGSITGAYWYPVAGITNNYVAGDLVAYVEFTVTASKAVTLTTISANMGQSQTSNIGSAVYVDGTATTCVAANKDASFSGIAINKTLAAGEQTTIKAAFVCGNAYAASAKNIAVVIGDLIINYEQ
jgi:hypothetical protein